MALSIETMVRVRNTGSPQAPKITPATVPAAKASPAILDIGSTASSATFTSR